MKNKGFILVFLLYCFIWPISMKIKSAVKKICAKCKMVKRGKHLRIICSNPKHKQKQ